MGAINLSVVFSETFVRSYDLTLGRVAENTTQSQSFIGKLHCEGEINMLLRSTLVSGTILNHFLYTACLFFTGA